MSERCSKFKILGLGLEFPVLGVGFGVEEDIGAFENFRKNLWGWGGLSL